MSSSTRPAERVRPTSVAAFLVALPETVAALLLGVSIVTVVSLLLGAHRPVTAGGLGVIAGGVLAWFVRDPARRPTSWSTASAVCLGLVAVLSLAQVSLAGQNLLVNRDPGFYTVLAKWLATNMSPRIDIPSDSFAGTPGLDDRAAGFYAEGGEWLVQGNHLVPGLIALLGPIDERLGYGDTLLLAGNVLVGAASLIMLYGFARLILGPWWALLPVASLGVSMPMEYFSRSVFSEPITVGFTAAAAAFLAIGHRRNSLSHFIVAGALAGASAMARIDGSITYFILIPIVAFMVGPMALNQRPASTVRGAAFIVGGAVTVLLGYLDLSLQSPVYLADLDTQVTSLQLVGGVSATAAAIILVAGMLEPVRRFFTTFRNQIALVGAVVGFAALLALSLRPLVWTAQYVASDSGAARLVAALQSAESLPVEPTRSYDELTLTWVAWYLGWTVVVMGAVGFAFAIYLAIKRADIALAALAALGLGYSILYLNRILITPDQIWAARRLLPVILPSFLLAATLPLYLLAQRTRWQWIAAAGAAVTLVTPGWTSRTLDAVPEFEGQLAETQALCAAVAGGRLLIADPGLRFQAVVTYNVWCDAPTLGIADPDPTDLAANRRAADTALYVVTQDPVRVTWATQEPEPFLRTIIDRWESRLLGPPDSTAPFERTIWLGEVRPDGLVVALAPE